MSFSLIARSKPVLGLCYFPQGVTQARPPILYIRTLCANSRCDQRAPILLSFRTLVQKAHSSTLLFDLCLDSPGDYYSNPPAAKVVCWTPVYSSTCHILLSNFPPLHDRLDPSAFFFHLKNLTHNWGYPPIAFFSFKFQARDLSSGRSILFFCPLFEGSTVSGAIAPFIEVY